MFKFAIVLLTLAAFQGAGAIPLDSMKTINDALKYMEGNNEYVNMPQARHGPIPASKISDITNAMVQKRPSGLGLEGAGIEDPADLIKDIEEHLIQTFAKGSH